MSEKVAGRLVFACGASMDVNNVSGHKIGERLTVGTYPHQGHQKPKLNGVDQECCFRCPSTIKLSGRKYYRSGWFKNGTKGSMMTCKITAVETIGTRLDADVSNHEPVCADCGSDLDQDGYCKAHCANVKAQAASGSESPAASGSTSGWRAP